MDANDAITKHLLANRDHEISVCMNVQHGGPEQLRVTINKLQRPYRPKLLGVYVVDTVQEALAKLSQHCPSCKSPHDCAVKGCAKETKVS